MDETVFRKGTHVVEMGPHRVTVMVPRNIAASDLAARFGLRGDKHESKRSGAA